MGLSLYVAFVALIVVQGFRKSLPLSRVSCFRLEGRKTCSCRYCRISVVPRASVSSQLVSTLAEVAERTGSVDAPAWVRKTGSTSSIGWPPSSCWIAPPPLLLHCSREHLLSISGPPCGRRCHRSGLYRLHQLWAQARSRCPGTWGTFYTDAAPSSIRGFFSDPVTTPQLPPICLARCMPAGGHGRA